jgi:hypothetical protein
MYGIIKQNYYKLFENAFNCGLLEANYTNIVFSFSGEDVIKTSYGDIFSSMFVVSFETKAQANICLLLK